MVNLSAPCERRASTQLKTPTAAKSKLSNSQGGNSGFMFSPAQRYGGERRAQRFEDKSDGEDVQFEREGILNHGVLSVIGVSVWVI